METLTVHRIRELRVGDSFSWHPVPHRSEPMPAGGQSLKWHMPLIGVSASVDLGTASTIMNTRIVWLTPLVTEGIGIWVWRWTLIVALGLSLSDLVERFRRRSPPIRAQ
jgi:hypothetical protein